MLILKIPPQETFNPVTSEFSYCNKEYTLKLEHSLISISKWESKWEKPFLSDDAKTTEEFLDYVRCMTINSDIPDDIYKLLTTEDIAKIAAYIKKPMTATVVKDRRPNKGASAEIPTSELIYYWMVSNQLPFDVCEKWPLNRLLTLIKVCNIKGNPQQMSRKEIYAMNAALNASRRKKYGTTG